MEFSMKRFTYLLAFTLSFNVFFAASDLDERREFLKEHGFLWIRDFFSEDESKEIEQWADQINEDAKQIIERGSLSSQLIVVPEAMHSEAVCRTEDNLSFYPEFHDFIKSRVTHYLNELMGEPYAIFKDKLNFKKPGGGGFSVHQDYPAYEVFGPHEHITAMVCADVATLENGCLQVATNWPQAFFNDSSLNTELVLEGKEVLPYIVGGPLHGTIEAYYADRLEWTPLIVSSRDLVIFSSFIPHYSEPNHSAQSRRAFFITHNRLAEGDLRGAYYELKRSDPENPLFHIGTPTKARTK
jgi:ectoine hydroxylase-related dioxygenase (phytanoyl-CoA dioxygenase family)